MIIAKAMPKKVVLVHFNPLEDFSNWREVVGDYSKNVQLAYDLMEIEV